MNTKNSSKLSFWFCDCCQRHLRHGEIRYNCTVCYNFDFCHRCKVENKTPHDHQLVEELAFGEVEPFTKDTSLMNMADAIEQAFNSYHDRYCMGTRDIEQEDPLIYKDSYSWITYEDVGKRIKNFGNGLRSLVKPRDYVGICSKNRPEWTITDYACIIQNLITIPIYCSFADSELSFIINNGKLSVIICDKIMLKRILSIADRCPSLQHLVCMDKITPSTYSQDLSKLKEITIHSMNDLEFLGSMKTFKPTKMQPTDCMTIIYTSGSTGFPKGAMISEEVSRRSFPEWLQPHQGERVIYCYRPLAWATDRDTVTWNFLRGGRVAYSTGDINRLTEEIALIRPTQFSANPSFWNQIYAEFQTTMSMITDEQVPKESKNKREFLLEKFSKVLGNRCRLIIVGGAKISPAVLDFVKDCFIRCQVYESYGITECGGVTSNYSTLNGIEYRLESVPEMGYSVDDQPYPRGEMIVKTPQMFLGYHNNPEETKATMTDDGFYRTGDIVELRVDPCRGLVVHVIDRRKNFFKLAQSQFVAPEYLQGIYIQSPFVEQIYIHGNMLDDCVSAVVVPNRNYTKLFIEKHQLNNFDETNPDQLFVAAIREDFKMLAKQESLKPHEIPAQIIIDFQPFTVENGFLTASLKPCRHKLAAHYGVRLKMMNNIEARLKSIISRISGQSKINENDENFFSSIGGDSLTAIRLTRTIEKDLGINVPIDLLLGSSMTFKRLTNFVENPNVTSSMSTSILPRLFEDSQINFPIEINKQKSINKQPSVVFVSGTTGFVGSFLLAELLKEYPPTCKFICLIRSKPENDPIKSIREQMKFYQIWNENYEERIIPLKGDLSKKNFGLSEETYQVIAELVDLIFHCGASVNFILSYQQLYPTNVVGTREIIRFATYRSKSIPIHYISTVSVLFRGFEKEEPIDLIPPDNLHSGYAQSKWVAEKLIYEASNLGLPVTIYRLGSISACSKTGASNKNDLHTILITAILKLRQYPKNALTSVFLGSPVDATAKSIVYLSQNQMKHNRKTYHIVYPEVNIRFTEIISTLEKIDIKLKEVSNEQWRLQIETLADEHVYFESAVSFLVTNLFREEIPVDSTNFRRAVSKLRFESIDDEYTSKWIRFLTDHIVP